MDVLTSLAVSLPDGTGNESLIQLVEAFGARHKRFAGKLEETLYAQRKKARDEIKHCGERIKKELTAPKSSVAEAWRRGAMTRTLELSSELSRWPNLRADNLHPFRLKVKELRYVLQLSSDSDLEFVDALGEVKDAIGEWHDWSELEALSAKVLGDKGRSSLSKQIGSVVQKKLQHALTQAEHLRRRYFDVPESRQGGRTPRHVRINEPVLATAARIAA